jgi:hypothetical protein
VNQVVTKLNSTAGEIVSWTKNDDDVEVRKSLLPNFSGRTLHSLKNVGRFLHAAGSIADHWVNRVRNPKAYKVKRGGGRA